MVVVVRTFRLEAAILLQFGAWEGAVRFVSSRDQTGYRRKSQSSCDFSHFRPSMERLPLRTDEELADLALPVQLILGATDRMIRSADTRDRMERLVKDLHVTWLENEGHMLGSQAARLLDFLGTHARSSTSARREMQATYGGRPEALRAKGRESRAPSPDTIQ